MSWTHKEELPIVIDVEASGFGAGSYPIEVGLVMSDGRTHCCLVRPEPDWVHWETQAEAVHQLSRDTLQRAGRPAAEVAHWLNSLLLDRTVYSDAWGQDYAWLSRLYEAAQNQPSFRLEALAALLAEAEMSIWHGAREAVEASLGTVRHRASNDARVLQQTLMRVRRSSGQLAQFDHPVPH
jgi:thiamine pyrophosphate-dependent acetolactate synthase large subunit-like protein